MGFEIGETVGDYQIIGLLGAGGMGKVYKVKNTIFDRIDAMKVLLPNLSDDQELADRFTREIKVLASLNHPNIAGLRTALHLNNQLLMVMEFVEGTTLDDMVKQGPIPIPDAINYITQVLSALGFAHKRGIIHRDIKPANMMLTTDGVIKLMDFGIAKTKNDKKLTQTGATLGSLFYMSAEQVQGLDLDGRSDLYSVGVSLYEMVTGKRPFSGKSDFDIMIAQLQQTPMAPIEMMPDMPKALNDIIVISLEKDPGKRFQTAEAFSAALNSISGQALSATPMQAAAAMPAASATDMMPTVTAPPPMAGPPVAVGGAVTGPMGRIPTTNVPTVMAPQPETPAVAPVPAPDPSHGIPAPSSSKGYRGLYMTLGALVVVAVLVVAGLQLPRILKTHASNDQSAQASNPPPPPTTGTTASTANSNTPPATGSSNSSSTTSTSGTETTTPNGGTGNPSQPPVASGGINGGSSGLPSTGTPANSGGQTSLPPIKSPSKRSSTPNSAGGGGDSITPPVGGGGQVVAPSEEKKPVNAQELAELQDQHDKLSIRAQSENDSVESLRKQIGNLRADVSAHQTRMRMYMGKFDAALNAGDLESANKNRALAETEVEWLEKFFNH